MSSTAANVVDRAKDDALGITPTQQVIISTIGALATSLAVTPLDVVKIRLQAPSIHICYCLNGAVTGHIHGPDGSTSIPKRARHFKGTVDAFVKISRSEGIRSLWSGLPPTLLMAIPATVVYFTAYDRLRADLWSWYGSPEQPLWIPALCAAAARCIAATTISPLEMVRTKMQSKKLSYPEVAQAISQLVRHGGVLSLWRGLAPTLLRDVPFSSIYWVSYEFMKQQMNQQHQPTLRFSLIAGAISGSLAAVSTLPFDVAKTHRQIELGERDLVDKLKGKDGAKAANVGEILTRIYRHNGVPGLFSGIVPRVIKVAPSCAIMISCYELGKQYFFRYNREMMQKGS